MDCLASAAVIVWEFRDRAEDTVSEIVCEPRTLALKHTNRNATTGRNGREKNSEKFNRMSYGGCRSILVHGFMETFLDALYP